VIISKPNPAIYICLFYFEHLIKIYQDVLLIMSGTKNNIKTKPLRTNRSNGVRQPVEKPQIEELQIEEAEQKEINNDNPSHQTNESKIKRGIKFIIDETLDNTLSDEPTKIKTIYHISDIHISRFDDRHREYMIVFQRLVEEIKKDTKDALIVICGDILHEKNVMSPGQLLLTKKFFLMLSELLPCIVIIGNHDISPHGNTIDALTPILKNLRTINPIYLLLEDMNYRYNNIVFGLTSMFANKVTESIVPESIIPVDANYDDFIKIGLYHGTICGSRVDNDFEMNNGRFNVTDFKTKYDLTLLGDIHKHGYLDKDRTIAYSGSLLQNNIGESLLDHGVLKWNLVTKKSKFIRIKNDWGFIRVRCDKDGIVQDDLIESMPANPTICIEYSGISSVEAEKYMLELRNRYNAKCSLVRTISDTVDIFIGRGKNKTKVMDISDNITVINLVDDFIKSSNYNWSDETKINVKNKFNEILGTLDYDYCNKVKTITIKKLSFSNFFNFGENNVIDYTTMHGIVGINGNSFIGKSTAMIDALLYSIFGECSRGDRYDVVGVKKTQMTTYVEFNINDDSYSIKRTREKQNNSKTKEKSKQRDSTEKIIMMKNNVLISKSSNNETNDEIRKIVCEYSNFINIAVMLQNCATSFVDLSNVDRKSFLCKLLKLDVFNTVLTEAKSRICKINHYLSIVHKKMNDKTDTSDSTNEIDDTKRKSRRITTKTNFDKYAASRGLRIEIQDLEKKYGKSKKNLDRFTFEHYQNNESISRYNTKKEEIDKSSIDISLIEKLIKKNSSDVIRLKKELKKLCGEIKEHENNKSDLEKQLKSVVKRLGKLNNVDEIYKQFQKEVEEESLRLTKEHDMLLTEYIPLEKTVSRNIIDGVRENLDREMIKKDQQLISIQESHILKTKLDREIEQLDKKNQGVDAMVLKNYYEQLQQYKMDHNKTIYALNEQNIKINTLMVEFKKLENHEFDPKCKYCMKYPVTGQKIQYQEDIAKIRENVETLTKEVKVLEKHIQTNEKYQKLYEDYMDMNDRKKTALIKLERIDNKLLIANKDIEIIMNRINNYEDQLTLYERNQEIEKNNHQIGVKCTEIKILIKTTSEKKCTEMINYTELQKKEKDLIELIGKKKNTIDSMRSAMDLTTGKINVLEHDNEKYENQTSDANDFLLLKREYESNKKKYIETETNMNQYTNICKILGEDIVRKQTKLQEAEEVLKEYTENENEKSTLDMVVRLLDSDGLLDTILSTNVIPKFEQDINDLLSHMANYRVSISFVGKQLKINKIQDDEVINIDTMSGCERFIASICFKIVLDQYNNHIKTGFILMDEVFNCCDDDNIDKLPSLFNYIKKHYDYAMVISHDDRIKKLYDINIDVVRDGTESQIVYGTPGLIDEQRTNKRKKSDEKNSNEKKSDEKKSNGKKSNKKKSNEKKSNEKKSNEKKSNEKKSNKKKSNEKKSNKKKSNEKKSNKKKSNEKKSNEKKSNEKKSNEKKSNEKASNKKASNKKKSDKKEI
jgi:DNA repair exonuclease SbcCD ATPase subunit